MKILAMDSTATAASVALMEDGCLLGEFYMNVKLTHSQTLLPMAEQLLACTQVALQDIGLFAVSAGPGSFTGVRIGVSAVKGLALAQSKPCVGVSTLEAMAYNAGQLDGIACCLMDARCGQVYGALFEVGGGRVTRLTEDAALPAEEMACLCRKQKKQIFLVGDGAQMCYNKTEFKAFTPFLLEEPLRQQHASGVAKAAAAAFARGQAVTAAELLPLCLRLPQAERELRHRQTGEKG